MTNKKLIIGLLVAVVITAGGYYYLTREESADQELTPKVTQRGFGKSNGQDKKTIEVVAENLDIPWEIAFLPSGELLVTERPGTLLRIGKEREAIEISGVRHIGEGGLLGLALHPSFGQNNLIYLYLTSEQDGEITNRVERYHLEGATLTQRQVIIDGIPGAQYHDGGRIEFGPDGYLYITTGDAGNENLAQDTSALNGKILRLEEDGAIPPENPFGNAVYSYGHRNPQGLAWDGEGRLWATEHGRSGIRSGFDELNLIEMGKNYGWPEIQGDQEDQGMVTPVIHSGPNETWAPAGAEYLNGSIFFAGLRGSTLYQAVLEQTNVASFIKHLEDEYGRLRAVRLGPDGYLYISTSNEDGRGQARPGDDKIVKIDPQVFR